VTDITHAHMLRCPQCRHLFATDSEMGVYEDGEHEVYCTSCDHEFRVSTRVSFMFTSPALLSNQDTEEE
jgi:uncharacterized protein YbaR (Trm112 family)